ncbi:MAG TPA: hypothetical protein VEG30_01965 [Terriglobales bacterium]|nr:hypothetical protein [Terriglobales bacterium]
MAGLQPAAGLVSAFMLALLLPSAFLPAQSPPPSGTQAMYNAALESARHKFQHIQENAQRQPPDPSPTVLSEREVNTYLASRDVQLPAGIQRLQFTGSPGIVHADALVDFDQVTAGRYRSNPLMSLFRGTNQVQVSAHASGSEGTGQVHIDSVAINGVQVPRSALEYFVDKFVRPKYPDLGLDSTFQMPYRVNQTQVGDHKVTLIQK